MVTWKLAKLQRVDDLKIYVQHFTLVMHAYKFFRPASFFLATAFSANEGDIENGDNSRQVKHKGFFSLLRAERYEFTSVRSRHGSFVNQTYDKRFLPPPHLSSSSDVHDSRRVTPHYSAHCQLSPKTTLSPDSTTPWQRQHKEAWKVFVCVWVRACVYIDRNYLIWFFSWQRVYLLRSS